MSMVPARPAESLADAFGVVAHLHFRQSSYGDVEGVVEAVDALGCRHVRSRLSRLPSATAGFRALAALGVKTEAVCGALGDPETMQSIMARVASEHDDPASVFSGFEGINEPNNKGRPWVEETRRKIIELHGARGQTGLEQIPIVAPALARVNGGGVEGGNTRGQSLALGDLTEWVDRGNIHVYPRGLVPSADIDAFMTYQRAVCGDLAIRCTEGGYFSAQNYVGGAYSTPEEAVRQYLPRMLLEHWVRGNERFYCYELLDDPDPEQSDREAAFGLISVSGSGPTASWRLKPRFTAMRNLLTLLGGSSPRPAPTGLLMSLGQCPPEVSSVLLGKGDGSFLLCLWRDVAVYDPRTGKLIEPESVAVRVRLAARSALSVYQPSSSSGAVRTIAAADTIDVSLAGELVVLAIQPPPSSDAG
jgi:hypothetical protein